MLVSESNRFDYAFLGVDLHCGRCVVDQDPKRKPLPTVLDPKSRLIAQASGGKNLHAFLVEKALYPESGRVIDAPQLGGVYVPLPQGVKTPQAVTAHMARLVDTINSAELFDSFHKADKVIFPKVYNPYAADSAQWAKAAWGISLGCVALILPLMAPPTWLMVGFMATALASSVYLGYPTYHNAWTQEWKRGTLGMNSLLVFSTLAALTASAAGMFLPLLALPCMLDGPLFVFGFTYLISALRRQLKNRLIPPPPFNSLEQLLQSLQDQTCDNRTSQAPSKVSQLQKGEAICLRLQPGDTVPLDVQWDEKSEESFCFDTTVEDGSTTRFIAPSGVLRQGYIYKGKESRDFWCTVKKTCDDSFLAEKKNALKLAGYTTYEKIRNEKYATANAFIQKFTAALLVTACVATVATACLFSAAIAIQVLFAVLIAACPCVVVAAPTFSTQWALNRLKSWVTFNGVHGAYAFETMGDADTWVFDLNGTLTEEQLTVQFVNDTGQMVELDYQHAELLAQVEQCTGRDTHPVGQAIVAETRRILSTSDWNNPSALESYKPVPAIDLSNGIGVTESEDGAVVYCVGNYDYFARILKPESLQALYPENADHTLLAFIRARKNHDGEQYSFIECIVRIKKQVTWRSGAPEFLKALQKAGKQIVIATGASEAEAEDALQCLQAKGVSVSQLTLHAGLAPCGQPATAPVAVAQPPLASCCTHAHSYDHHSHVGASYGAEPEKPTNKLELIKRYQAGEDGSGGTVVFVGDAGNDAFALAQANASICLRHGTNQNFSLTQAGIVTGSAQAFSTIPFLWSQSRRTQQLVVATIGISLAFTCCATLLGAGVLLGVGILVTPAMASAAMLVEGILGMGILAAGNRILSLPCYKAATLPEAAQRTDLPEMMWLH